MGVSFGVGNGVGSGCGGTRGSGKRGSLAADSASERFQSGPNGPADSVAAGDADRRGDRLQPLLGGLT